MRPPWKCSGRSKSPACAGRPLPRASWQPAWPSRKGPRCPALLLDPSQDSGSSWSLWVFSGG